MLDEISRILAWHLAARNKQRLASAVRTQPIPIPPIRTPAGVRVESSTTRSAGSPVESVAQAQDPSGRRRGLGSSRDGSVRLVVAGIGVADRGDHSMINSDLDRLQRTPRSGVSATILIMSRPVFNRGTQLLWIGIAQLLYPRGRHCDALIARVARDGSPPAVHQAQDRDLLQQPLGESSDQALRGCSSSRPNDGTRLHALPPQDHRRSSRRVRWVSAATGSAAA